MHITRAFMAGDTVLLTLPMHARFVFPDPRIDAVRGAVAVERGPEIYCIESTDIDDGDIATIRLDAEVPPIFGGDHITVTAHSPEVQEHPWPYSADLRRDADTDEARTIRLIPYHSWGERGACTMRVWVPLA